MKNTKGFSLIEVVVALLIFSLSVITIYQLITSTSISIFSLENRLLAKEVANNRISLINTIEKPRNKQPRNGVMNMGGKLVLERRIYYPILLRYLSLKLLS